MATRSDIPQANQSFMVLVRDGDNDDRFTILPTRDLYRFLSEVSRLVIKPGNPLSLVEADLLAHTTSDVEHGATGNIVGDQDFAKLLPGSAGVVNKADDVGDPTGTFINLAAVEAWAATLRTNLQNAGIMA